MVAIFPKGSRKQTLTTDNLIVQDMSSVAYTLVWYLSTHVHVHSAGNDVSVSTRNCKSKVVCTLHVVNVIHFPDNITEYSGQ